MTNTTLVLFIGMLAQGIHHFNGKLDEIKIYKNRILTKEEIEEIYELENAGNSVQH